jgi:hypothetical protein
MLLRNDGRLSPDYTQLYPTAVRTSDPTEALSVSCGVGSYARRKAGDKNVVTAQKSFVP